jgi:hypothetical protein
MRPGGFRNEAQRVKQSGWTSLPSSPSSAWSGVRKPRHFRGVRLWMRTISCSSASPSASRSRSRLDHDRQLPTPRPSPEAYELMAKAPLAVSTGTAPDFLFGSSTARDLYYSRWAREGHLVDLSDAVGPWLDQFDPDAIKRGQWIDPVGGQSKLYGLPIGRTTNHIHVPDCPVDASSFQPAIPVLSPVPPPFTATLGHEAMPRPATS